MRPDNLHPAVVSDIKVGATLYYRSLGRNRELLTCVLQYQNRYKIWVAEAVTGHRYICPQDLEVYMVAQSMVSNVLPFPKNY